MRREQEAQAVLAEKSAVAEGIRKERAALNGSAGDAYVSLQLIEALQKKEIRQIPKLPERKRDHRRQQAAPAARRPAHDSTADRRSRRSNSEDSMLNIAGPEYDFGSVVFVVLEECEHRRRGFDDDELDEQLLAHRHARS